MTVTMKIEGVTHWSIPVDNLEESERFYRDILGLEYKGRLGNSTMACVVAGDHNILLCQKKGEAPQTSDAAGWDGAGTHHSFHTSPEEWEAGVRTLAQHHVRILDLVYRERGFFTGREIYFADPSGNVLELRDASWKPGMPRPSLADLTAGAQAGT